MERFISVQCHGRNEMLMLVAAIVCACHSPKTCLQLVPATLSSFTQSTALVSSVQKFPLTQVLA